MQKFTRFIPRWFIPCALGLLTACDAESEGLEVLDEETGRIGYLASSPAEVRSLIKLADAGAIEIDPEALSMLREQFGGNSLADDHHSPRNLAECPSSNATTKTYRNSFGSWGLQYVASAEWKKIGFGPHRPVRAEVTVCGKNGCSSDVQVGTPLNVLVTLLIPLPHDAPVYASAKIIDVKNGQNCVASSAFQYWPGP